MGLAPQLRSWLSSLALRDCLEKPASPSVAYAGNAYANATMVHRLLQAWPRPGRISLACFEARNCFRSLNGASFRVVSFAGSRLAGAFSPSLGREETLHWM